MSSSQKLKELLKDYFDDNTSKSPSVITERHNAFLSMPIEPSTCTWQVHQSPERFSKKFVFDNKHAVKNFIVECLNYETEVNHSGSYRIDDLSVTVEVYTHDIDRITELDQEFVKNIDFIYKDVLNFGRY